MEEGLIHLANGAKFHGGRYEIVRCINAGGMGAIYEVVQLGTQRRRALKVMLPSLVANADLRSRFRLEATVTADIDSEYIVETIDADIDAETGAPFMVLELLKGEDLGRVLEARGALPPAEVVALLAQVALGLQQTHARGIVHRDLKPENLFMARRDDGSSRLKILDFGIAKVVAQGEAVKATQSFGSPLYMSPEQIEGSGALGPATDLYALGHIAFALLVGEAYWERPARELTAVYGLLTLVLRGATEPASVRAKECGVTVPPGFDAWFSKATAIDPTRRFQSAADAVSTLATALGVPAPSLLSGAGAPRLSEASAWSAASLAQTISATDLGAAITGAGPGASSREGASRMRLVAFGVAALVLVVGGALGVLRATSLSARDKPQADRVVEARDPSSAEPRASALAALSAPSAPSAAMASTGVALPPVVTPSVAPLDAPPASAAPRSPAVPKPGRLPGPVKRPAPGTTMIPF